MPAFLDIERTMQSALPALEVINILRSAFIYAKRFDALMEAYQSGRDPVLSRTMEAMWTAEERAALSAMRPPIAALIKDWEAKHRAVLGLVKGPLP